MQDFIWQPKGSDHIVKEQVRNLLCGELSLPHKARHKAHITQDTLNASHNSIETITQGQVGHEINGPTPKPSARDRQRIQQPSRCLRAVLGTLANLTSPTNPLTTAAHVGPPHTSRQQLMHLLGTKVGCSHAAVGFIQQQLPARGRHHQSSSLPSATKHKFETMHLTYMKQGVRATCSSCKLSHFHVSMLPRGIRDTSQERWFHFQRLHSPYTWSTWSPTCPTTTLAS